MRLDARIIVLIATAVVTIGIFLNMKNLAQSNQIFAQAKPHIGTTTSVHRQHPHQEIQHEDHHHYRAAAGLDNIIGRTDKEGIIITKVEKKEEFKRGVVHATLHEQGLSHMAFHHESLQLELAEVAEGNANTVVIVGVEWGNDLMAFATAGYRVIAFEPTRKYYDLVRKRLVQHELNRLRRIYRRYQRSRSGRRYGNSSVQGVNGDDEEKAEEDNVHLNYDQYGSDTMFSTMKLTHNFTITLPKSNRQTRTKKDRQLDVVLHNVAAGNVTGGEILIHYRNVASRVRLSRVDDVVREPVRLLSIDIQGAELSVLQGATRLLQSSPAPMVWTEAIACNPRLPHLLSLLDAHDFAIFDFVPVGTPFSENNHHNNHSWTHRHNFAFQPRRPSAFSDYLDWLCAQKHATFNILQTDFVAIRRDALSPSVVTRLATIADNVCMQLDSRCVLRSLLATSFPSTSPSTASFTSSGTNDSSSPGDL